MNYVSFYALLSAVNALSSLYVVYVVLYYAIFTRHPSQFKEFGFSPPKNKADWYKTQTYTVLGAIGINIMLIVYTIRLDANVSLVPWMVLMSIVETAFIYVLRKEIRDLK